MLVFLIKLTAFLLTGVIALVATRKSTAAMRHLLGVCTLAGSLLLPLGALAPSKTIAFRTNLLDTIAARSSVLAHAAAWHWSWLVPGIWAFGTALLLLRLTIGYWRAARLVRSGTLIDGPSLSADVSVPMASGLFRPVVIMPRGAADWPECQRDAAVRHEIAHIDRKDLWANLATNLACAFYWFHPLVWMLASRMRVEQEAACDDAVLHSGFDAAAYAEALLAVAKNASVALVPGCAMATESGVKSRITRLFDGRVRRPASRAALYAATLASATIFIGFLAVHPVRAQQVYKVGGDVTSPQIIYKVDPQYTEEARAAKIAGTVTLQVTVGTDGLAHDISIIKSPDAGLAEMAAEAIEQWRFAPGTRNGMPVDTRATIEVNFRLL